MIFVPLHFSIVDIDGSKGISATVESNDASIDTMDLETFKRFHNILHNAPKDAYQFEFPFGHAIHFA